MAIDLEPYREAIRERICTSCLDGAKDGTCRKPPDETCAFETHLEQIVTAVLKTHGSADIDDYVHALRTNVCPTCRQDEEGECQLREIAHCAVDSYLIPVIEVIEDVARSCPT